MKKLTIILFSIVNVLVFSQKTVSVEKSLTGIQVGFLGADLYNETRISDKFVIRSQFTLNPSIWGGDFYDKTGFALTPEISVSSKYYYNLSSRAEKGKNISHNSGNYIDLKLGYLPNWFVISNSDIKVNESLFILPSYGLRRNFSKNFNYEFNVGLGIGKVLKGNSNFQAYPDLSFKVGYDF
ncbi:MAG: hypothetical protein H7195_04625 [Chryseobacterium sp.]|nr:hypothetical protein [Chryseobacterium sp.]